MLLVLFSRRALTALHPLFILPPWIVVPFIWERGRSKSTRCYLRSNSSIGAWWLNVPSLSFPLLEVLFIYWIYKDLFWISRVLDFPFPPYSCTTSVPSPWRSSVSYLPGRKTFVPKTTVLLKVTLPSCLWPFIASLEKSLVTFQNIDLSCRLMSRCRVSVSSHVYVWKHILWQNHLIENHLIPWLLIQNHLIPLARSQ